MTIAIMLVVVMSSVIFNIQPVTAIMIVVLALLDDIPIMTIAYDNVRNGATRRCAGTCTGFSCFLA